MLCKRRGDEGGREYHVLIRNDSRGSGDIQSVLSLDCCSLKIYIIRLERSRLRC